MLANLNDVLIPARRESYGVGLFNTVNYEMAKGVLKAAEEMNSPVIIGTAEVLLPYAELEDLSYFLIPMAKKASVPVVIHYDHGLTYERCIEALKLGFTSIMYDCSTDSYEENVRKVAELTYIAHQFGATVEGELGHVGGNEGESGVEDDPSAFYTEPEEVIDYVSRTKVDALAIAVGTAHGAYKFKPKLDFERIATIKKAVDTPLVLHGGSGLTPQDFRQAIALGISKVNIFTDINMAGASGVKKGLEEGKNGVTDLMAYQIDWVYQATKEKMQIFKNK